MKVGILCAGDTEFLPFQKYLEEETVTKKAMLSFHQGKIGSVPVVALYSGVCKVNAAIAAQLLIDVFQTDVIINAGTAGGIDEGVRLFDTVVADGMAYHDVADDILTEFHPWLPSIYFAPSQKLLELMRTYSKSVKYRILFGTAVTGEAFVENDRRREIAEKYHPLTVDMETAAIAHVCYVNEIPFLSARTVTDTARHDGIENFEKNCERASEISAEIVASFVRCVLPRF